MRLQGIWCIADFLQLCDALPKGTYSVIYLKVEKESGESAGSENELIMRAAHVPAKGEELAAACWYSQDDIVIVGNADLEGACTRLRQTRRFGERRGFILRGVATLWNSPERRIEEVIDSARAEVMGIPLSRRITVHEKPKDTKSMNDLYWLEEDRPH